MTDDSVRNIPSPSPTNSESKPSQSHESDTNAEPNEPPVYDQHSTANNQSKNNDQQNNRGHRFAKLMERFPSASAWVAIFTGILIVETFFSIRTAQEANQLNAGINRPWVRADISPTQLIFERHGENFGVGITTSITLKNSGQFPANSAFIYPSIVPMPAQTYNAIEIIKSHCVSRRSASGLTGGDTLFKDSPQPSVHTATIEDVRPNSSFAVWLLICITYDIPFTSNEGLTGYLFSVSRRDNNHPGARFSIEPQEGTLTPPVLALDQEASYAK